MIGSMVVVLLAAYISVCLLANVFVRRVVSDPRLRSWFLFVILSTPIVAIVTIVYALLGERRFNPRPVSQEIAEIEQEIEAERISVYGGSAIKPLFAETMQNAYMRSLSRAAKTVDSVVGSKFENMVACGN